MELNQRDCEVPLETPKGWATFDIASLETLMNGLSTTPSLWQLELCR